MREFLKCSLFALGVLTCGTAQAGVETENTNVCQTTESGNEMGCVSDKVVEAPNYDKVVPIPGWTRQSGDSATTVNEWKRWWTYLRMKAPVVMNWINGLKLRIYPGNEVFRSLFVRGIYDPNLAVIVNALLPKNGVLIDVGSNMGYCSLLASEVVGEDGKIIAIEPSERDFIRLLDNINLNNLKNVSSYRLVISDREGDASILIASEERSALNTLGTEFAYKGVEKLRSETVKSTTLDAFIEEERIEKIDVLKLDIEGSEYQALKGAKNSIEKFRPTIILGLNGVALKANHSSVDDVDALLRELRYKAYDVTFDEKFQLTPLSDIRKASGKIIVCLHESFMPPVLPQPKNQTWGELIKNFFVR